MKISNRTAYWVIGLVGAAFVVPALLQQPAAAPPASAGLTGGEMCVRDLTRFVQFKDPASVRINSVEPNLQRPGRYFLSVSGKNSFGGYADPVTCTCGTAVDRVTDLHCDSPTG